MFNKKIKINNRLKKIAELVEENSHVIDIGCDHAFLDIYLAQTKKNISLIASDNKEGPLEQAKANIKKYKLENKIKAKLGNGVDPIEEDTDTIVISGMGGLNIVGILKYKTSFYKQVNTLVLSPNNDVDRLRKEIAKLGFYIVDEVLVEENKFIYPVIVWKRGRKRYNKKQLLFGPILLEKKDKLFLKYIEREKEIKERLLAILPKKYWQRRWKLKKELKTISKII